MSDKRLNSLLSLLDDDDDRNICQVMIELLRYGDELEPYLQKLHESDNVQLRRRVHQLQAIMSFRRQRAEFALKLKADDIGLFDGLLEAHLLWYDSDTREEILDVWHKFLDNAGKFSPDNIEKLSYFMRRSGFVVSDNDDFQADCFCLGIVIEDKVGADFLLCAIAAGVAEKWGFELKIVRRDDRFILLDFEGKVLSPADGWLVSEPKKFTNFTIWKTSQLLRLVLANLFLVAVESDSFRYLSIIGKCLAIAGGEDDVHFLPFPYAGDPK